MALDIGRRQLERAVGDARVEGRRPPTVAIVGGGLSGLAMAIQLVRSGIRDFTIVDPACGSGAFLVAAFDEMARRYRDAVSRLAELGIEITFEKGEEMRTEISSKFTPEGIGGELDHGGFVVVQQFGTERGEFLLALSHPYC